MYTLKIHFKDKDEKHIKYVGGRRCLPVDNYLIGLADGASACSVVLKEQFPGWRIKVSHELSPSKIHPTINAKREERA